MSTSTIGQYFSNRVEELISEFTGHTLIFFKGFGLEQIRFLITHPNSLLDDASLLHEGFLDLEAIDDRWLDLAASIKSATKPLVGFYEELLAIRQFLPRMKVDKIVVIENNILSPWVPCISHTVMLKSFLIIGRPNMNPQLGVPCSNSFKCTEMSSC